MIPRRLLIFTSISSPEHRFELWDCPGYGSRDRFYIEHHQNGTLLNREGHGRETRARERFERKVEDFEMAAIGKVVRNGRASS